MRIANLTKLTFLCCNVSCEKINLNSSYECVKIVVMILLCVGSVRDKVLPCQLQDKSEMLPVIGVTVWVWSKNLMMNWNVEFCRLEWLSMVQILKLDTFDDCVHVWLSCDCSFSFGLGCPKSSHRHQWWYGTSLGNLQRCVLLLWNINWSTAF
jgi:hypothetical protein